MKKVNGLLASLIVCSVSVFPLFGCNTNQNASSWIGCESSNQCELITGYYCGVIAVNTENKGPMVADIKKWFASTEQWSEENCGDQLSKFQAVCNRRQCKAEKVKQ